MVVQRRRLRPVGGHKLSVGLRPPAPQVFSIFPIFANSTHTSFTLVSRRSFDAAAQGAPEDIPGDVLQAPFMMRAGKPVAEDALRLSGQPIVALLFGLSLTGREVCSTFVPSERETEPARRVVIETEPRPRSGGRRCRDRRPRRNGFDGHASLRGSQRRRWAGSREAQSEARNRKAPQRSEKPRFGSRSGAGGICHRERQPDRDPGGRGDFEVVAPCNLLARHAASRAKGPRHGGADGTEMGRNLLKSLDSGAAAAEMGIGV